MNHPPGATHHSFHHSAVGLTIGRSAAIHGQRCSASCDWLLSVPSGCARGEYFADLHFLFSMTSETITVRRATPSASLSTLQPANERRASRGNWSWLRSGSRTPVANNLEPCHRSHRRTPGTCRRKGASAPSASHQFCYRTTIDPRRPGSGKAFASASTAARAAPESRRQAWAVRIRSARRHVPPTSPSTRTAPGQTRGVHSARRRAASATRSSRSAPWRRK
jgi:hypothetical protein